MNREVDCIRSDDSDTESNKAQLDFVLVKWSFQSLQVVGQKIQVCEFLGNVLKFEHV